MSALERGRLKRHAPLLLFMVVFVGRVLAQPAVPLDGRRFVKRRDRCDHVRGEPPCDARRKRSLEQPVRRLCTGTDRQFAALQAN